MDRCTLCWGPDGQCESCREAARASYGFKKITNIKTGHKKMKFPKAWNKMNLKEQEDFLVKKLNEIYDSEKKIRSLLAQVRGGRKVELIAEERGDIQYDVKDNNA
jgi:hypothetical protein